MADEALTAGAVARRLGVAVTTLRTWHQRYGLGPSHHVPGQHRRYTPEDMDRLQVMRRLTAQGVAPAEAAAWARRVPVPLDVSAPVGPHARPEGPPGDAASVPSAEASPARASEDADHHSALPGAVLDGDSRPPALEHPGAQSVPSDRRAVDSADLFSSEAEQSQSPWHGASVERLDQLSAAETSRDAVQPDHDGTAADETSGAAKDGPARSKRQRRAGARPHDWSPDAAHSAPSPAGTENGDPRYPAADRFDLAGAASEDQGDTFFRVGERLPTVDAVWPEELGQMFVARDGGGHAIRTGRAGPVARGLARAAMRLDGPALRDILEMTVTDRGVVAAWEEVIMPVLIGVGERYAATKRFIEVEHILSRVVTEVLGSVTRPPSSQIPRVLLAAADEEQHTLPLEALAAALAQAGVASRLLGARVPAQAVAEAIARTGPAVLVLWSQLAGSADPAQWDLVLSGRHRPLLAAAAGPGWLPEHLPPGVTLLGNLAEAVELVSAVALPTHRPH